MTREQVIAKVKKCLRLSKSSNEHEAAAALRQAQKLMEKFQLGTEELLAHDASETRVRSGSAAVPSSWEARLARMVADAFACDYIFCPASLHDRYRSRAFGAPRPNGEWAFIGCGPSAHLAQFAFVVLMRNLRRERAAYMSSTLKRCSTKTKTKRADIYCIGWVAAVSDKVKRLARPENETRAIVAFKSKAYPATEVFEPRSRMKRRSLGLRDQDDLMQGARSGSQVDIRQPMSGDRREAIGA